MAEIYGSFGRVITGSTLGSSIGSLARQILSDKISRIFNAYRDEVQYEGSLLDAGSAISKLNSLLAMVDGNSEAARDIKEYIDAIRQEDRNRRAKKAINLVDLAGPETKDYETLIKTLKGILLDPTITETEKESYKAAIANKTREYVNNIIKQFNEGGSITVGGSSIDFGLSANNSKVTDILTGLMNANPEMRQEIGKSFDSARAMIIIKQAEFDFAASKDVSNKGRAAAYAKLKTATQEAYDLLGKSEFDLANSGLALDLLQSVNKYAEYIQSYEKAAAAEYANEYVKNGFVKATSYFDAVDKFASQVLGAQKDAATGGQSMKDLVLGGEIDQILDYLDLLAGQQGGSTSFAVDGKSYSFSRDALYNQIKQSGKMFSQLDDFAHGNTNVDPSDQTYFDDAATALAEVIKVKNIFAIEDRYDAAREILRKSVRNSGGDIYKIRDAYVKFGNELYSIAGTIPGNTGVEESLRLEAAMFVTGDINENNKKLMYGVWTGNFDPGTQEFENFISGPLSAHDVASSSSKDQLETFVSFNGEKITFLKNYIGSGDNPNTFQTEFPEISFSRPNWANSGIKTTSTLGESQVHQVLTVQDKTGKDTGFLAYVNGKFVGGTIANNQYSFFYSKDLNERLAALGITSPRDIPLTFVPGTGSFWRTDSFTGTVVFTVSAAEIRDGTWVDAAVGIKGQTSGLQETNEEFSLNIEKFIAQGKFQILTATGPYSSTAYDRLMIKDEEGNWQYASTMMSQETVKRIVDKIYTVVPPGTTGPISLSSGSGTASNKSPISTTDPMFRAGERAPLNVEPKTVGGVGGGFGFGVGRGVDVSKLRKPTDLLTSQSAVDFRAGERSSLLETTKPIVPAPIAPVIPSGPGGGGPVIPKPIAATTRITTPSSLTSQAMVDFRAGERASLGTTTPVGGFFRNSPFRISL